MDGARQVELLRAALRRVAEGPVLDRVVAAAAPMLGLTGMAAALMSDGNGGGVVAAGTVVGPRLLDLEFVLGEGPATDAFSSSRDVLVDDLAAVGPLQWPAFTAAALDLGVGAVYAFPARLGGIRVGVLVAHRDRTAMLGESELADARVFAEVCSTLMVDHMAGLDSSAVLAAGWPNRAVVHQATGMVSAQLSISLPAALARLRAYAFSRERTLEAVARDVVARELLLDSDQYRYPPPGGGRTAP